jgi:crotonobetainyl-CoA:carnitine CoA-transferase CaiB-like acyl-CoA transferase
MFRDLLVIETAGVLAGPSVGMFFAELGARVIKIENARGGGDVTRKWKLAEEDPQSPVSAYFSSVNLRKEHRFADLTSADDRSAFDELVRSADVLITNHLAQDAEKLGLQRERLRSLNPVLVHGHIKGFADDPGRTAYDVVLQAEMGYIGMTGSEGHPAKYPVALVDVLAAHQLKEGILLALYERRATGLGAYVEVALDEAALTGLVNQASNHLMTGHLPARMGTLHPNIAPYGELFTCRDGGSILLAVGSDAQFRSLCVVLELPSLIADPQFASNRDRVIHRVALAKTLAGGIAAHDRDALLSRLVAAGVPAGAVRSVDEVLTSPVARRMIREEMIDGVRTLRISGNAFRIEER